MIKETKLVITHRIDDQNPKSYEVTVDGVLEDRLFCYGLLEYAKDIIQDYNKKGNLGTIKSPFLSHPLRSN